MQAQAGRRSLSRSLARGRVRACVAVAVWLFRRSAGTHAVLCVRCMQ